MLSRLCTIYLNKVKIMKKQQEIYGTIIEMNQIVVLTIRTGTE